MVTEVAILPFKDGERAEDGTSATGRLMQEQLLRILESTGVHRCYWGRAIEQPEVIYLFVDANTVDEHTNALRELTAHASEISTLLSKPATTYHAAFMPSHPYLSRVLNKLHSPITEIVIFYFAADLPEFLQTKISSDTEIFRDALQRVSQGGCNSSAGGWVLEQVDLPDGRGKGKAFLMVIGWDSVDAHNKCLGDPTVQKQIPLIIGLPGVIARDMCHVSLTEVQK